MMEGRPVLFELTSPYRPLDSSRREIRLLKLYKKDSEYGLIFLAELQHFSLDKPPDYVALSYTWNDEYASGFYARAPCRPAISMNGHWVEITPNLAMALSYILNNCDVIRSLGRGPHWYWIDALCIDQSNVDERSQQVAMMKAIYESADHVQVWLGQTAPDYYHRNWMFFQALDAVEDLYVKFHREGKLGEVFHPIISNNADDKTKNRFMELMRPIFGALEPGSPLREAMDSIRECPWWWRIWTIQELAVSKAYQFLWSGVLPMDGDILMTAIAYFDLLTGERCFQSDRMYLFQYKRFEIRVGSPAQILQFMVYWMGKNCNATDPRDIIYALLGLVGGNDRGIRPDYSKPVERVYAEATKAFIGAYGLKDTKRLQCLSLACSNASERLSGLPSWVPDYRRETGRLQLLLAGTDRTSAVQWPNFCAGGDDARTDLLPPPGPDVFTLSVAGIQVGTVAAVGPTYWVLDDAKYQDGGLYERLRLCVQGYLFMNNLIMFLRQDIVNHDETGWTVRLRGPQWLDVLKLLLLHFLGAPQELSPPAQDQWLTILSAGAGLWEFPHPLDPAPVKHIPCPYKPDPSEPGRVCVSYEYRRLEDVLTDLQKTLRISSQDGKAALALESIIPQLQGLRGHHPDSSSEQGQDSRGRLADQIAMFPGPWRREIPDSFMARLDSTCSAMGKLETCMRHRTVFRLDDGRLGVARDTIRPGDTVHVVLGAEVPYVLRSTGNSQCAVISEVLLKGAMNGEELGGERDIQVLELR
jgi:hypothetical protein